MKTNEQIKDLAASTLRQCGSEGMTVSETRYFVELLTRAIDKSVREAELTPAAELWDW